MIYSQFGTLLTLVSKQQDSNGKLSVQATSGGTTDIREYHVGDLKADDGLTEVAQSVAKLNWKVSPKKAKRTQ